MKLITSNVKSFGWELGDLKGFPRSVIQSGVGVIDVCLYLFLCSRLLSCQIVYLCHTLSISHSIGCGFYNKDNKFNMQSKLSFDQF